MGFLSSLFGGGGGGYETPPVDPTETLAETKSYYESYKSYLSDAQSTYDNEQQALEARVRMGTINDEAYRNKSAELKTNLDTEVQQIKTGPTAGILQDEYDFQRSEALKKYTANDVQATYRGINETGPARRFIETDGDSAGYWEGGMGQDEYGTSLGSGFDEGPGYYGPTEYSGGSDQDAVYTNQFYGETDPNAKATPFQFSSFDDFYSQEFGDEVPSARGGTSASASLRAKASGSAQGKSVGVGQIYSIY